MHPTELLDLLVDLALAAGLEVREIRGGWEGDLRSSSGSCRVKGKIWVLLAPTDSLDERIDALGSALAAHARDFLESRYLPPAVRERLGADFGGA
jgi:hypothetical protein